MKKGFEQKNCPQCGGLRLKTWEELNADEKILAEKLPSSAEFSLTERRRHLFCPRCWFESSAQEEIRA